MDTQRSKSVHGNVYGSASWKEQSNRRVSMLPPDFRGSGKALLQHDSELFRGHARAPGGMYNYDNMGPLEEEPLISDIRAEDLCTDFRRKTHFELQAASAIIDVDSAYVPGGQARTKAEAMFRHNARDQNQRRAHAEFPGHPHFATNWDSSLTRKHDLAINLPRGVGEKIQRRAWRQVERAMKGGKSGFSVQPELVPKCGKSSFDMFNVDSSLTRKFGSSMALRSTTTTLPPGQRSSKKLPPLESR